MSKLLNRFQGPLTPHLIVPRARQCEAYQFADGFDNYNSAALLYPTVSGTVSYSTAYRRFAPPAGLPGQGIQCGINAYVRRNLLSNQATLIIKVAVLFSSLGNSGTGGNPFLTVFDGGTAQWSLDVFPTGSIGISRSFGGSVQAQTASGMVQTGLWCSIEVQATIAGSSSSAQIWLNGVEVINATGINLQQTGDAYGNQVAIGDVFDTGLAGIQFDDFRIWDNTGSIENAALGTDSRIITKLPNGNGVIDTWTPNGASANWQCVDDNPPDGDTTYVSSSTVSNPDEYTAPSAGFTAAPVMVLARTYGRKDDGSTRTYDFGVVSGGSSLTGGVATMSSSYAFYDGDCTAEDPHTSAAWTAAGADAAGFWKLETA